MPNPLSPEAVKQAHMQRIWADDVMPFMEWAQSYLDSGRWAGHSMFDAVKTEILERDRLVSALQAEQAETRELVAELDTILKAGGIKDLARIPEAMFIIDIRKDKTALEEASRRGVKVIALCDTNVNPTKVDYNIPCNDDAVKAIDS